MPPPTPTGSDTLKQAKKELSIATLFQMEPLCPPAGKDVLSMSNGSGHTCSSQSRALDMASLTIHEAHGHPPLTHIPTPCTHVNGSHPWPYGVLQICRD
uniref:Uncharacterized protein n=1 Tax=Gadus morhua TaxID=8049 RepID=A0A8C5AJ94_GADMO